MGKHRIFKLTQRLRAAAAILMVSSLGLFYPGTVSNLHAQSPAKAKSSSPGGGPKEGIKVHGRWTIDILSADGKLVKHHKFENGLRNSGAASLASFLGRTSKAGQWLVSVGGQYNKSPCRTVVDLSDCFLYEPATHAPSAPEAFKTLTIGSQGEGTIVLSGTATAQRDGEISNVATYISRCPVDTQGICSSGFDMFTQATPAAIPVVGGQIIQVTVVISFS